MRRGVLPFGLVSLLPAPGTRAGSALQVPCHVPVWWLAGLSWTRSENWSMGKREKMEADVCGGVLSFPRLFFLPSASYWETARASQKLFSKPSVTQISISPAAKVNTSSEGKQQRQTPKPCKLSPSTLKNSSDRGLCLGGMLGGSPQGPPRQTHVLPPAPQLGFVKCWAAHHHVPCQHSASSYYNKREAKWMRNWKPPCWLWGIPSLAENQCQSYQNSCQISLLPHNKWEFR